MKRTTLALLAIFSFALSSFGQSYEDTEIMATKITDQIYMLEGMGGNMGLFVGEDGVVLIDDQYAPLSEKINKKIEEITGHPLKYLINTHWHGDHTGGNENFSNYGATIIAHDNVRKRMSSEQLRPFRPTTPPAPETAQPSITFDNNMQLHLNGESLQLIHVHNAHTDGDAFIYFPMANVLHMGDCFFKGRFPYVDMGSGGSPDGALKAIEAALMITDKDSKIIPGHGSLATRDDLLTYQTMLKTLSNRVKEAIQEGMSLEETKSANLTDGYEDWGTGFINDEKIIQMLFSAYNPD